MPASYPHIVVERYGSVACVRLARPRLDESEIYELSQEVLRLGREDGCPRIALSLGPRTPECLYSVFLARLISPERRLREAGGGLKLCECTPEVLDILEACVLRDRFDIVTSPAVALAQWGVIPGPGSNGVAAPTGPHRAV